ncbi:MAG: hypothetical protein ACI85Q_002533, partial [Salibacteraceae bacterium]
KRVKYSLLFQISKYNKPQLRWHSVFLNSSSAFNNFTSLINLRGVNPEIVLGG